MQTKQIIQACSNVIRISRLSKGSIYKRFDKNYSDRTFYGIVNNVYNDGVDTIIEATEYEKTWDSINASNIVMTGEKDYTIFPAKLDDLKKEFSNVIEIKEREIKDKEEGIEKCKKIIKTTKELLSGEMQKELKSAEFKEFSQEDFNKKVEELSV